MIAPDIGQCPAKNRVMSNKNYLQRTQFSGMKLEKDIISYRRLKTQKHSVSIGFSCFGFYFHEHFNRQFTYAVFLYIQNRKMCLSKKVLLDADEHVLT